MNSSKNKISLITCFMGEQLPAYFEYFLVTAGWNSTIEFIIFSNANTVATIPSNVKFVPMHLAAFRELATEKLGTAIAVNDAEKLSDFKPAYGLIFKEYLTACDYWGYVDFHVLLGNIRAFLSDVLLESHDFVSVRDEFPASHFSVYRNNEQMCHLFQNSKDWMSVFNSPNYHGFEEFGLDLPSLQTKVVSSNSFESMLQVFAKNENTVKQNNQNLEHTLGFRELVEVSIEGCKVVGKEGDYMLVNFLSLSRNRRYRFPTILDNVQRIYVDIFGIKSFNNNESLTQVERIADVLDLPISIDYERVSIESNNEVRISLNGNDYLDLYRTSLLDTQILLYIHHHTSVKGSDIVEFFLHSNIFHISKPVPPDRAKIDGLFFGYLGSQMQYGQILVQ
jgi:hypothetical protein